MNVLSEKSTPKQKKKYVLGPDEEFLEYKYYDMHQVIGSALAKARRELEKRQQIS